MSQIDMVVFGLDGSKRRVCGDFAPPVDSSAKPVEIHVIVRQGDVVVRGHGQCQGANWEAPIETPGQLTVGQPAIACAVAIIEKEDPAGLETLSWVQEVQVVPGRENVNVPLDFPEPESVISAQGQLADGRTVASSLAIFKEENPQGRETLSWHREVSIRPVVAADA